eukprot:TRINITY_DN2731_c0_g2_i2.p1 TRINITY_DN2731_c0_g2~~TRINITY_DN2731_c0_g2_i2.p1  ORF type:complete len:418 (+),score=52.08 TRINITY_DN2731_c0_g2_i2:120-1373(+)
MVGARVKSILIWTIIQWAALTARAMEGSNYTDAEALLAVKAGFGDPVQLRTWSNLTNVCTWMGTKCDDSLNRVVFLSVQNENRIPLTGNLSSFIGNLTELTFLDLSFNQISGPIPREIGRLVKLTKLYLGRNLFTGNIPAELGNLVLAEELTMDRCQLSGTVPVELGKLTTVTKLDLSFNSFNAAIPKELGNLPSIKQMYLAAGKFTGEIPPELGLLPFIEKLDLSNNNFTGSVPLTFLNLTDTLYQLGIGSNRLSGYLPPELSSIEAFSYTGQNGDGAFCSRKDAYPLISACPPGTPGVPPEGGTGESSGGPKLAPILGGVLGGGRVCGGRCRALHRVHPSVGKASGLQEANHQKSQRSRGALQLGGVESSDRQLDSHLGERGFRTSVQGSHARRNISGNKEAQGRVIPRKGGVSE